MPFRHLENVGFANLEDILHGRSKNISVGAINTFRENVSMTSFKTGFQTFLKSCLKAIAKLVNGF